MTNEAAERLRALFTAPCVPEHQEPYWNGLLDAALVAERKATVERYEPVIAAIRRLLKVLDLASSVHTPERRAARLALREALAIFDAEAARGA